MHLYLLLCLSAYVAALSLPRHRKLLTFSEVSASNAITFSSYILSAANVESTTWKLRGVAIAGSFFAVGIHTVAPRVGRGIQDVLSVVKLFTLLFIVCCGFAALAGHLRIEKPDNFTNALRVHRAAATALGRPF